ncbi:OmpA family protein [Pararhodobacter sp.]|uniref:OmpA family protein n=1 Tax=Pararhodobacter sp. TaxID=2127056 RepID=UPI003FA7A9F5
MLISRRFLLLGLGCTALVGCENMGEVGAQLDEGGFGNPTAHNTLVQTGQMPFVINLAERFAAEVTTTVNFAFDSATLDAGAQAVLRRQATWIRQFPEVTFRVFGHTDLVGSAAYNHQLGLRRARAVVDYLVHSGISRNRLEALVSYGDTQPLIFTQARERQNRRTVTEVSGFMQRHPTVLNGQYARIIHREYVESATWVRPVPYL